MTEFLKGRRENFAGIEKSVHQKDWREVARLGHILHGVCGGFGFEKISQMGLEVELLSAEGKDEEILRLVAEMRAYLENTEVEFVDS